MNRKLSLVTILLLATLNVHATTSNEHNTTKKNVMNHSSDVETEALELKGKKLSLRNSLLEEKLKGEHAELLTELQKVRWEKELLTEKLALKELKEKNVHYDEELKHTKEIASLEYNAEIQELKNQQMTQEMELKKTKWELDANKLQSEVAVIEAKKTREKYISTTPKYLDNPVTDTNCLVISDRRIALNGLITEELSTEITNKINYFNNKDSKKPIFIVIDDSNGGSAMAGYLILKAMKASKAPIYVVLRSFAASMAAIIVTLADKSYAYGHATILHHQPSTFSIGNLTEQEESLAHLNEWWVEFGEPIAKKMGITGEEFKRQMYEHSARGDWQEMAKNAQKLHWVDNIIDTIVDTSVLEEPIKKKPKEPRRFALLNVDENVQENKSVDYKLPKLNPSDVYFVYDPDGHYK